MSTPPTQAQLLERIDARLERIEARLAKLDPLLGPLLDAAPGALAMLGDTFDEFSNELGDLDERLRAGLRLLERATRPQTLAQLEAAIELLDAMPGAVAMLGDSFDELAREAAARGVPLERIVPELGRTIAVLLDLLTQEQIQQLLSSDLLLPNAIEALATAARALAVTQYSGTEPLGLFGALAAMREPEVQRALGFALDVARRFGTNLSHHQRALAPATAPTKD